MEDSPTTNKILEDRLKQASDTITNLTAIIRIAGVFILIISFGLPIVTYVFGIKPSQDAVKELENSVNRRVELYFEESRNSQIVNSIKALKSNNKIVRTVGRNTLNSLNPNFSDVQISDIIDIIEKDSLPDNDEKYYLRYLLLTKKSKLADYFFMNDILMNKRLRDGMDMNTEVAISYFTGYQDHNCLKQVLEKTTDKYALFTSIMDRFEDKHSAISFLNNKDIMNFLVRSIPKEDLIVLKDNVPYNQYLKNEEVFQTYWYNELITAIASN